MFRKLFKILVAYILTFNVIALLWVIAYAFLPIPFTKLMVIEGQKKEISYAWKSLDQISDKLALAVMCSEDQNFLIHHGFDLDAIMEAEKSNKEGKRLRGASTITQQVAKNVFLWPGRSWIRKAVELYFALLIDAIWSKQRIMEVYLNVAEMGDGVFGAEAASRIYFKKPASKLTINESVRIAVTLPSPKRYSVLKPGSYLKKRAEWVKRQMSYWGNKMTYDPEFLRKMIK
ncbi:MAG: monofunctional biosynthetic peptidoglycan transglycosylase [Bacteroidota bacterium]